MTQIHDMHQRVVIGDTDAETQIFEWQYIPDEFWEQNRLMREASMLIPMGEMHQYARPPVQVWERLKREHPGLNLDTPLGPHQMEAVKERANDVMKCLRLMGEARCITTVHTF